VITDETISGSVRLTINDAPLDLNFTIPTKPVKLRRMLPVFQNFSNTFIDIGVENIEAEGKQISCRAGCGACCRQLVPVAETEAFDLQKQVEAMDEPRRTEIRRRFREGMEKLNEIDFFSRLETAAKSSEKEYEDVINDYFRLQIACPFLENESCSIHRTRPIACREYLVTSPPEFCSDAEGKGVENVEFFLKVKNAVISMSREKQSSEMPFVPLIKSLEWAEKNPDNSAERDGKEWLDKFFRELQNA
jgi:Fe-S-cluster containining protein